jgi:hypothetical protein
VIEICAVIEFGLLNFLHMVLFVVFHFTTLQNRIQNLVFSAPLERLYVVQAYKFNSTSNHMYQWISVSTMK